ncbi:hypothetical protein RRG08_066490 [Elysia crispata]|uniref:Uncharacterized protein n=1 Tax=Elysia crispata TaxID=231223 RepID=A0AAE1DQP6_9GAST|nr:hypothetical protein RRG08_066490 [Elysia crispata]
MVSSWATESRGRDTPETKLQQVLDTLYNGLVRTQRSSSMATTLCRRVQEASTGSGPVSLKSDHFVTDVASVAPGVAVPSPDCHMERGKQGEWGGLGLGYWRELG